MPRPPQSGPSPPGDHERLRSALGRRRRCSDSLDDRFGAPGAAPIPDFHGDMGARQTATLRIVHFDADDDRTLVRRRFFVSPAREQNLPDLRGRILLDSRTCGSLAAFSWRIAARPIVPTPAASIPAVRTTAVTRISLAFLMDLMIPSASATAYADTVPTGAPLPIPTLSRWLVRDQAFSKI